jgi:hypothetical protein
MGSLGESLRPRSSLRRLILLATAFFAISATLLISSPTAQAAAVNPTAPGDVGIYDVINTFRNQASGLCLDGGNSNLLFTCNGTAWQQWNVHVWADGTRELRNVATGQCLDSVSMGVFTSPCDTSTDQSWYVLFWSDGTISLKNQYHGRCLEDNAGYAITSNCNASPAQSWY